MRNLLLILTLIIGSGQLMTGLSGQSAHKIFMMIGDGFNGNEFWEPYYAFRAAGYEVEVASYEIRAITCGNRGDVSTDFTPQLTLSRVTPSAYVAFFLPGGKGPENLEKYPRSIDLCRSFNESGILISSLCHGPRLLGQAGVMQGRMTTYLHKVRDEIPEFYARGELGHYRDIPLVEDGNLLTSRYPEDVTLLMRATLVKLATAGYGDRPQVEPRVLVVDGGLNKLEIYAYLRGGLKSHAEVRRVDMTRVGSWLEKEKDELTGYDLLVILDGKKQESADLQGLKKLAGMWGDRPVMASSSLRRILGKPYRGSEWLNGDITENLTAIVQKGYGIGQQKRGLKDQEYNAILAIEPDFDEEAYLAMKFYLEKEGYRVGTASSLKGTITSMNGLKAAVDRTYADLTTLPDNTVIMDPGGIWPYEEPLEPYEEEHFQWIHDQWRSGARVLTVGFGSYYLCSMPAFKGRKAATSDQGEWSFGKRGGAGYSRENAFETAPGLVTVKSTAHLVSGIEIFENTKTP